MAVLCSGGARHGERRPWFAGVAWSRAPGLGLSRVCYGERLRGMSEPPEAKVGQGRAWTELATARSGAARRRKSGPAADGRLGRAKGGNNLRKWIRGPGWCSPWVCGGRFCGAGRPASRMGGGAGAVSRRRALQVLSVLLGSTDRRLEGLRGSHGGHRGAGVAGGEKKGGG